MKDQTKISGRVKLVYRNTLTGDTETIQHSNLFVNGGRNKVRDYLAGDEPGYPTHCALSDDGDPVIAASSDIGSEVLRIAVTERIKRAQELQINTFFNTSQASEEYIQKVGLVDADTGGAFFAIALFTRREKDPNETLTVEWVIEIGG